MLFVGFENLINPDPYLCPTGMKLEAIDKTRLSSLRVAVVNKIVGRRVYVKYERMEEDDEGFWFHEKSSMIHPVGWARVHGHELLSTEEYARSSLAKALGNKFTPKEASWVHIPPLELPESVSHLAPIHYNNGSIIQGISDRRRRAHSRESSTVIIFLIRFCRWSRLSKPHNSRSE